MNSDAHEFDIGLSTNISTFRLILILGCKRI